jgi:hypothetical protein
MPAADDNIAALRERLDSPLLGSFGFRAAPDPRVCADELGLSSLD